MTQPSDQGEGEGHRIGESLRYPEDQTRNLVACLQVQKTDTVEKFKEQMLVNPLSRAGDGARGSQVRTSKQRLLRPLTPPGWPPAPCTLPGAKAQAQGGKQGRCKARLQVTFTLSCWQAL